LLEPPTIGRRRFDYSGPVGEIIAQEGAAEWRAISRTADRGKAANDPKVQPEQSAGRDGEALLSRRAMQAGSTVASMLALRMTGLSLHVGDRSACESMPRRAVASMVRRTAL
jgi:hypothetical protein